MDPINQNNPGVQNQPQTPPKPFETPAEEHHSSAGPIIGSVIIVLIIVLGGLYLYGDKLGIPQSDTPIEEESISADQISAQADITTENLLAQGKTDAIDEIEADLSATDLNALDAELANISAELSF